MRHSLSTRFRWLPLIGCLFLGTPATDAGDLYTAVIKPLLAEKCVSCHGPVRQEAGLRLDAARLLKAGGDAGPVVTPGDASSSELMARISAEPGFRMPPSGEGTALTSKQRELLRRWIDDGMPAPESERIVESPRDHWAFQPIRRPRVPEIERAANNAIDAFIGAVCRERGLPAVGEAEPETVLRRLTFGLLGLPPTPDQRATWLDLDTPAARRRFVDRLLAEPAHAERWARHWMDVWRYSDWDGYKDQVRGSRRHIWRWREWIVESLAQDKPYDQMVIEMLAGDEVAPRDEGTLRATGFLARNHHHSNRNIWLDATVEHTAKAFLALTLNCARCHDHKFDPVSQREYYEIRAIFEPHGVRTDRVPGTLDTKVDGLPRVYDADLDAETSLFIGGNEKHPDNSIDMRADVPEILGIPLRVEPVSLPVVAHVPGLRPHVRNDMLRAAREKRNAARRAIAAAEPSRAAVAARKLEVAEAELRSLRARWDAERAKFSAPDQQRAASDESPESRQSLAQAAERTERELAVARARLAVADAEKKLADVVDKRETPAEDAAEPPEVTQAREVVGKAEKSLGEARAELEKPVSGDYEPVVKSYPATSSGRRSALARWITHPKNPLTARVAVNHIWMRHFGQPLVENVFDFGLRTPRPLQADLLDWLSVEFIESGWSMRHIHRLIVHSRTYRQRSHLDSESYAAGQAIDPDNRCFWRFNIIRLEAEAIRDSLMAVAGDLDRRGGGPDIDFRKGEESHRRSLYFRHAYEKQMEMLTTFDAASPNECYRRRPSIIPQQALVLSNSELSHQMAERLASSIDADPQLSAAEPFVRQAFVRVLGRDPRNAELAACVEFLAAGAAGRAHVGLVHALMNHNDFVVLR